LNDKPNAQLYAQSPLSAADILDYGIPNVVLATGANWRVDCYGKTHKKPLPFLQNGTVISPDTLMQSGPDSLPDGPIVVFDDERYYLGGVLAEQIVKSGRKVLFVTPAPIVSPYTENTLEQGRIQSRLIELGITILPLKQLAGLTQSSVTLACIYSGNTETHDCAALVPVTSRLPNDQLWHDLQARKSDWADAGLHTVSRIGDCLTPGIIAMATQAGYAYGVGVGCKTQSPQREMIAL
ncbi:MAG: trimethylamine dehydrogenase, partial [Paracoccaceae bacterium]